MNKQEQVKTIISENLAARKTFTFTEIANSVGLTRERVRQIALKHFNIKGKEANPYKEYFCKYCSASLGTIFYGYRACASCKEKRAAQRAEFREKFWYIKGRLTECRGCGTKEKKSGHRHGMDGYCINCCYKYLPEYRKRNLAMQRKYYLKHKEKRAAYNRNYMKKRLATDPAFRTFRKRVYERYKHRYHTEPDFKRKILERNAKWYALQMQDPEYRKQRQEYMRQLHARRKLEKQNGQKKSI